jgi:pSer/pThr/pTyr-binding forkhead associated (FHA) protein
LGLYPYQCQHYTCQHRFYRKLNCSAANHEDISISSVSENLYSDIRSEVTDTGYLVKPEVLSHLSEREPISEPLNGRIQKFTPQLVSNVTHYDFRPPTSVIPSKFLTLTWRELGKQQIHTISSESIDGDPIRVTLGRDRSRCDLVFIDQTVSGLNAEIYFDDDLEAFYIRNLRPINPPFVNDQKVVSSTRLASGMLLSLGKVAITIEIESDAFEIEPTILFDRDENSA